jgi:aryl-alcohol dehydrogenase-like predicted oxidoreductase
MATSKTSIPIPGAKTVDQIEENARSLEFGPLSKDLVDQINNLFATLANE